MLRLEGNDAMIGQCSMLNDWSMVKSQMTLRQKQQKRVSPLLLPASQGGNVGPVKYVVPRTCE